MTKLHITHNDADAVGCALAARYFINHTVAVLDGEMDYALEDEFEEYFCSIGEGPSKIILEKISPLVDKLCLLDFEEIDKVRKEAGADIFLSSSYVDGVFTYNNIVININELYSKVLVSDISISSTALMTLLVYKNLLNSLKEFIPIHEKITVLCVDHHASNLVGKSPVFREISHVNEDCIDPVLTSNSDPSDPKYNISALNGASIQLLKYIIKDADENIEFGEKLFRGNDILRLVFAIIYAISTYDTWRWKNGEMPVGMRDNLQYENDEIPIIAEYTNTLGCERAVNEIEKYVESLDIVSCKSFSTMLKFTGQDLFGPEIYAWYSYRKLETNNEKAKIGKRTKEVSDLLYDYLVHCFRGELTNSAYGLFNKDITDRIFSFIGGKPCDSQLANYVLTEYNNGGNDVVIILYPETCQIGFRKLKGKGPNLTEVAKYFLGGGHEDASGATLSDYLFIWFLRAFYRSDNLDKLYPKEK